MGLIGIKPQDRPAPNTDSHGIAIEFPDDHTIQGIKIRILGVTPEQLLIAAWHLERQANLAQDGKMLAEMQRQAVANLDADAIRRDPTGGLKS